VLYCHSWLPQGTISSAILVTIAIVKITNAFLQCTGYAQVCNIINVLQEAKIFFENKMDLGMACHTPPLKKVKKQGEMPLPSLVPSHL